MAAKLSSALIRSAESFAARSCLIQRGAWATTAETTAARSLFSMMSLEHGHGRPVKNGVSQEQGDRDWNVWPQWSEDRNDLKFYARSNPPV